MQNMNTVSRNAIYIGRRRITVQHMSRGLENINTEGHLAIGTGSGYCHGPIAHVGERNKGEVAL
jgi:hypothetical protein